MKLRNILNILIPILAASAAVAQETPARTAAAATSDLASNLVFVADTGTGGAGSGFICEFRGKPALFTNIHVVAGMRAPQFTKLDKTPVQPAGAPSGAVGHDILYYPLPADTPAPKLRAAPRLEDVATIGDEIFVLGNSEGARVIAPLTGKLVGLGPDLIEVTAEFVPGNSGSPIIHAKTGTVLGIATYLSMRDQKFLSGDTQAPKIRRFGYRLDSVKNWQPVDWALFAQDRAELEKIQRLTADLIALLRDMRDGVIDPAAHKNPAIARHVATFSGKTGGATRISEKDRADAVATFLRFMRSVSQQDIADATRRIRYDYFTRALSEEKAVRTQLAEVFDMLVKKQK